MSKGGLFEWLTLLLSLSKASLTFKRSYLGKLMIELPRDNGLSIKFNILADLIPYLKSDHLADLRANLFQ